MALLAGLFGTSPTGGTKVVAPAACRTESNDKENLTYKNMTPEIAMRNLALISNFNGTKFTTDEETGELTLENRWLAGARRSLNQSFDTKSVRDTYTIAKKLLADPSFKHHADLVANYRKCWTSGRGHDLLWQKYNENYLFKKIATELDELKKQFAPQADTTTPPAV